jgi:GMP synthase-like glutamine amidotransferase
MKIALLQCDSVSPEFVHIAGDYPGMFIKLFGQVDSGVEFEVFDVREMNYPDIDGKYDGYISTGSRQSVYEDIPWIKNYTGFIKELYGAGKKLAGICFGHQMIAHALGGKVEEAGYGWGIGLKKVEIKKKMPWMKPELDESRLLVTHKDQVVELPPASELLGWSSYCPNAMFLTGERFLGIQPHPEFEVPYARELILSRTLRIGEDRVNRAMETIDNPADSLDVARWILNFLGN